VCQVYYAPANVSSAMSDVVVQYNIVLAFTSNRPFACEVQQLSRTVHPGDAAINRSLARLKKPTRYFRD
jgi:hypothetical protein